LLFVAVACVAGFTIVLDRLPAQSDDSAKPPHGPFGHTLVSTPDGKPAEIDSFFTNDTCAVCHPRQFKELKGSMHSAAHEEPLYRRFAELARTDAGEKMYTYCSGCHSPAGVVSGLIPGKRDPELPAAAKAGVTCDVCHQISRLSGAEGAWGEQGNASFTLLPGRVKFGTSGNVQKNRAHAGAGRDFFAQSEFCATCHTVIHPTNGLRIERTYAEWKSSIYAKNGVQCQDCHMRSVEDAAKVALTLKPVVRMGQSTVDGPMRQIHSHFFVGGNANASRLAHGLEHTKMAEERLKSAARIELWPPKQVVAGETLSFGVVVYNAAAGHDLPTGIVELREMWVDLQVEDANGKTLFRSGELDKRGEIPEGAIRFGAITGDKAGNKTYKPWEATQFLFYRTVPPKGYSGDQVTAPIPRGTAGPLTIEARLRYRSAPPHVVAEVMKDEAFTPKIVEMTSTRASVTIRRQ
jgi:hypothetical protein